MRCEKSSVAAEGMPWNAKAWRPDRRAMTTLASRFAGPVRADECTRRHRGCRVPLEGARARPRDVPRVPALEDADLRISCRGPCQDEALAALRHHREQLESYIREVPAFLGALTPLAVPPRAPLVVRMMAEAGYAAGVGPMAAVAGALAELVGQRLLKARRKSSSRMVVTSSAVSRAPLSSRSMRVPRRSAGRAEIKVAPALGPIGVCTSSGTRGEVSALAGPTPPARRPHAALADAAATAIGNVVEGPTTSSRLAGGADDPRAARVPSIVVGERIGAWGDIELVEIEHETKGNGKTVANINARLQRATPSS